MIEATHRRDFCRQSTLLLGASLFASPSNAQEESPSKNRANINAISQQEELSTFENFLTYMNPSVNELLTVPLRRLVEANNLIVSDLNKPVKQGLDLDHRNSYRWAAALSVVFTIALSYAARLPNDFGLDEKLLGDLISKDKLKTTGTMNVYHLQSLLFAHFSTELVDELTSAFEAILKRDPEKYKSDPRKISFCELSRELQRKESSIAKILGRGAKSTAQASSKVFSNLQRKRGVLDLALFLTSYPLAFHNEALARAEASILRTGIGARRQLEVIPKNQEAYNENRARISSSMVTFILNYVINYLTQIPLGSKSMKISDNKVVNRNYKDLVGSLLSTLLYIQFKVPAQRGLENHARASINSGEERFWTKAMKPYIQPISSQYN